MLVCETFVEHIAKEIGMDVSEVRRSEAFRTVLTLPAGGSTFLEK